MVRKILCMDILQNGWYGRNFLAFTKRNKCENDNNLQQGSLRTFCMLLLFQLPKLKTFKFGISQNLSSTCCYKYQVWCTGQVGEILGDKN